MSSAGGGQSGIHIVVEGQGPSVVLTHGLGQALDTYDELVNELVADHTVIRWDLPGHGESLGPPQRFDFSRDTTVGELAAIVTHCDDSPVVVGHSLGGYLVLAWAATTQLDAAGLCILSTGPGFRNTEKREKWNAMSRRNAHRFGVAPEVAEMNLQHDGVVIENLDRIDTATELLVGDQDNPQLVGGMQYLEAKLASARLTVVGGAGHDVHRGEGTAEVAAAIRRLASSR